MGKGPSRRGTGTDAELAELASVTMYTPDEELELLFDPTLIPAGMRQDCGPEYHVRLLLAPIAIVTGS